MIRKAGGSPEMNSSSAQILYRYHERVVLQDVRSGMQSRYGEAVGREYCGRGYEDESRIFIAE